VSAPLRCAVIGEAHHGAVLLVEIVLDIRIPGEPSESAPLRIAICEGCLVETRRQLAALRQEFGKVAS
jgi:hypothetical protein